MRLATARQFALLGLVLSAACVSTSAALLNESLRPASTCADAVQLYTTPSKAPADYKELGLITSKGATALTSQSQMLSSMREEAAKIGATGVVLSLKEASATAEVLADATGGLTLRQGQGLAIYSPSDTAKGRTVCAASIAATIHRHLGETVELRNADVQEPWLSRSVIMSTTDSTVTLRAKNLERTFPVAVIDRAFDESMGGGPTHFVIALKKP